MIGRRITKIHTEISSFISLPTKCPSQESLTLTLLLAIWAFTSSASGAHHAAPAPAVDCSSVILNLADCLSFVTASSTVKKPEGSFRSGLKTVLKTNAEKKKKKREEPIGRRRRRKREEEQEEEKKEEEPIGRRRRKEEEEIGRRRRRRRRKELIERRRRK
ncbi:hypothetical protein LguiB_009778 [Lonicera macranthoides]